jgi:hypothetical protein
MSSLWHPNIPLSTLFSDIFNLCSSLRVRNQVSHSCRILWSMYLFQGVSLLTITQPNSVHMLWLIPQYFVITMGEVMFSITGLEFSFTQVCSVVWLLCVHLVTTPEWVDVEKYTFTMLFLLVYCTFVDWKPHSWDFYDICWVLLQDYIINKIHKLEKIVKHY